MGSNLGPVGKSFVLSSPQIFPLRGVDKIGASSLEEALVTFLRSDASVFVCTGLGCTCRYVCMYMEHEVSESKVPLEQRC